MYSRNIRSIGHRPLRTVINNKSSARGLDVPNEMCAGAVWLLCEYIIYFVRGWLYSTKLDEHNTALDARRTTTSRITEFVSLVVYRYRTNIGSDEKLIVFFVLLCHIYIYIYIIDQQQFHKHLKTILQDNRFMYIIMELIQAVIFCR